MRSLPRGRSPRPAGWASPLPEPAPIGGTGRRSHHEGGQHRGTRFGAGRKSLADGLGFVESNSTPERWDECDSTASYCEGPAARASSAVSVSSAATAPSRARCDLLWIAHQHHADVQLHHAESEAGGRAASPLGFRPSRTSEFAPFRVLPPITPISRARFRSVRRPPTMPLRATGIELRAGTVGRTYPGRKRRSPRHRPISAMPRRILVEIRISVPRRCRHRRRSG